MTLADHDEIEAPVCAECGQVYVSQTGWICHMCNDAWLEEDRDAAREGADGEL